MPTTKTISKVQEKRNRQFRDSLTRRLTILFNPFRNRNYSSYVDFNLKPHLALLDQWGKFNDSAEAFESVKGKTNRELFLFPKINPRNYKTAHERVKAQEDLYNSPVTIGGIRNIMSKVSQSRNVINLLEIHRMQWLAEVKEAFDNRFNTMIDKMCNSIEPKKNDFSIDIKELSNSWDEFEVLIKVEDTTFHARAIWVHGVSMISHYRFITTTRQK